MTRSVDYLAPFKLEPQNLPGFEGVMTVNNFASHIIPDKRHYERAGIYFWLLDDAGTKYKLYIGRTKNLSKRMNNYSAEFQPHSPNDCKIQILLELVHQLIPSATLELRFSHCSGSLQKAETDAIRQHRPLLNGLPRLRFEAKAKLRKAFAEYYHEAIMNKLRQDAQPGH